MSSEDEDPVLLLRKISKRTYPNWSLSLSSGPTTPTPPVLRVTLAPSSVYRDARVKGGELVYSGSRVIGARTPTLPPGSSWRPTFTHQQFPGEMLFGYRGPGVCLRVWVREPELSMCVTGEAPGGALQGELPVRLPTSREDDGGGSGSGSKGMTLRVGADDILEFLGSSLPPAFPPTSFSTAVGPDACSPTATPLALKFFPAWEASSWGSAGGGGDGGGGGGAAAAAAGAGGGAAAAVSGSGAAPPSTPPATPWTPPGVCIHRYSRGSAPQQQQQQQHFVVHRWQPSQSPPLAEYLGRLSCLAMWLVETAAPFTDPSHPKWTVLSLYEEVRGGGGEMDSEEEEEEEGRGGSGSGSGSGSGGSSAPPPATTTPAAAAASAPPPSYRLAGYAAVYRFTNPMRDSRPDILRLTQLLLLPHYQRAGHGVELMGCIAQWAEEEGGGERVGEVGVEDPCEGMTRLRDAFDLSRAIRLMAAVVGGGTQATALFPFPFSPSTAAHSGSGGGAPAFLLPPLLPSDVRDLTEEEVGRAARVLRIVPSQVRRVYLAGMLGRLGLLEVVGGGGEEAGGGSGGSVTAAAAAVAHVWGDDHPLAKAYRLLVKRVLYNESPDVQAIKDAGARKAALEFLWVEALASFAGALAHASPPLCSRGAAKAVQDKWKAVEREAELEEEAREFAGKIAAREVGCVLKMEWNEGPPVKVLPNRTCARSFPQHFLACPNPLGLTNKTIDSNAQRLLLLYIYESGPGVPNSGQAFSCFCQVWGTPKMSSSFLSVSGLANRNTWHPNGSSCALCRVVFSLFRRPHHCRVCGRCADDACAPLTEVFLEPAGKVVSVRLCTACRDEAGTRDDEDEDESGGEREEPSSSKVGGGGGEEEVGQDAAALKRPLHSNSDPSPLLCPVMDGPPIPALGDFSLQNVGREEEEGGAGAGSASSTLTTPALTQQQGDGRVAGSVGLEGVVGFTVPPLQQVPSLHQPPVQSSASSSSTTAPAQAAAPLPLSTSSGSSSAPHSSSSSSSSSRAPSSKVSSPKLTPWGGGPPPFLATAAPKRTDAASAGLLSLDSSSGDITEADGDAPSSSSSSSGGGGVKPVFPPPASFQPTTPSLPPPPPPPPVPSAVAAAAPFPPVSSPQPLSARPRRIQGGNLMGFGSVGVPASMVAAPAPSSPSNYGGRQQGGSAGAPTTPTLSGPLVWDGMGDTRRADFLYLSGLGRYAVTAAAAAQPPAPPTTPGGGGMVGGVPIHQPLLTASSTPYPPLYPPPTTPGGRGGVGGFRGVGGIGMGMVGGGGVVPYGGGEGGYAPLHRAPGGISGGGGGGVLVAPLPTPAAPATNAAAAAAPASSTTGPLPPILPALGTLRHCRNCSAPFFEEAREKEVSDPLSAEASTCSRDCYSTLRMHGIY